MNKDIAPIALFVFNRPVHTLKTLESLYKNTLASESKLYIFCDGPKKNSSAEELSRIEAVRSLIRKKKWCKEVEIIQRVENFGLEKSLIDGVGDILKKHKKIIVLEDDLVCSVGFLRYMNDSLSLYENEDKVLHVSGYMDMVKDNLPETFFLSLATCWGWGTWERAWSKFTTADASSLIPLVQKAGVEHFNLGYDHFEMLKRLSKKKNQSWAILWHASIYLQNGLCLHPSLSLIRNIGCDDSGVHCGSEPKYMDQRIAEFISVKKIPLEISNLAENAIIKLNKERRIISQRQNKMKEVIKLFIPPILLALKNKLAFSTAAKVQATISDWNESNALLETWGKNSVWNEIELLLHNEKGKVLDLGCGNGVTAARLSKFEQLTVHGCDISEGLIEKAKQRSQHPERFFLCDVTDLSKILNVEYDIIFSIGLLQYIPENKVEQLAKDLARTTKKFSFHQIPVSATNENEGIINSWHAYLNNSSEWWEMKFRTAFPNVRILDSCWSHPGISAGKWILCYK